MNLLQLALRYIVHNHLNNFNNWLQIARLPIDKKRSLEIFKT